jgi:hypothetical protein
MEVAYSGAIFHEFPADGGMSQKKSINRNKWQWFVLERE